MEVIEALQNTPTLFVAVVALLSLVVRPLVYEASYTMREQALANSEIDRIKGGRFYSYGEDQRTVFIEATSGSLDRLAGERAAAEDDRGVGDGRHRDRPASSTPDTKASRSGRTRSDDARPAAKRGGKAYGIEYNPDMVELARRNAQKEGVADKAIFKQGDIFTEASKKDYMQASLITLFLLPDLNVKLRPTLLDMKPGTRIVSNSFTMGDWKEDEKISAGGDCTSWCTAYLWIIPAKVAGNWKTSRGDLTLKQEYQMLSGNLARGNVTGIIDRLVSDGLVIRSAAESDRRAILVGLKRDHRHARRRLGIDTFGAQV